MENLFVKGASLTKLGATQGGESAMGDYVVAAKLDIEEAEGISLSSKPLNVEEIHTNQGPPRPTGKETLGEATLKSKSVALAESHISSSNQTQSYLIVFTSSRNIRIY
ncbi:hypothetical protein PCASD_04969 [Puccinia coronata f. sp. avenae]|uniref:Uncharacterized protein n=1 Tax=Puccinia coronata f. sp. avenae TaxID=200324 RepID=A0A2N5VD39_9BASI|nr:hypothetical protein PCASD_04969 [Puccinia coronata f. sp. avenae]